MSLKRNRRPLFLGALVALLCAVLAAPATAISPEEERLEATQERLADVRSELDAAQTEQSSDADSFARAERQLMVVMEALNAAKAAVDRQEQAVERAAEKLAELQRTERTQRRAMASRAVRLYKRGAYGAAASVLTSGTPGEALERTALVQVITRADTAIVEQVAITRTAISAQRRQLKVKQEDLERVAAKQRDIAAEAEELRDHRALALAASSAKVQALEGQEADLQEESREIAALARRAERIAAAQAASRAAAATAAPAVSSGSAPTTGGGWSWPASGPVTSGFGYRWGRMHEGIDIGAPMNAPTYAATAGTVTYAGSMGGYGNLVLIDHGNGIVTAYAHHTSILVGVGSRVSAGQQIGTIGMTGNVTGPHMHFEVRVGGSPRDPMAYL